MLLPSPFHKVDCNLMIITMMVTINHVDLDVDVAVDVDVDDVASSSWATN